MTKSQLERVVEVNGIVLLEFSLIHAFGSSNWRYL
jgi:hypothetical protein